MSTDLRVLRARASGSDGREAFEILERTSLGRIGVGVRLGDGGSPRYFVEVILDPSPDRPRVRPSLLGKTGALAAQLLARGYTLRAEDDGCVTCERAMEARQVLREIRDIRGWLAAD